LLFRVFFLLETYGQVAAIRGTSLDSLRAANRTVLFSTPNLAKGGVDWLEGFHTRELMPIENRNWKSGDLRFDEGTSAT
jgi:hypothetical protein